MARMAGKGLKYRDLLAANGLASDQRISMTDEVRK